MAPYALRQVPQVMKVQMKRTQRGPVYNPTVLDTEFVRGTIPRMPIVGESMRFYHRRMDEGWWTTSPVEKITRKGKTYTLKTMNSVYTLIKGWGQE